MARIAICFGDLHASCHDGLAVEVLRKTISRLQPHVTVSLGDLLDCGQFSTHPPTWDVPVGSYEEDLHLVNDLLDFIQQNTRERTVLIAGNHEHRISRWAASHTEGRGAYTLLAPRLQLMRGRSRCTYIPYGSASGHYPHYKLNSRVVAIHGWSYAQNAARVHLRMSQGKSVIFGHSHRAQSDLIQNIWGAGTVQARSAGCLCRRIPLYGTGRPVEWSNGFVLGYLGRHSDTLYSIPIMKNFAVLPSGEEIRV